MSTRRSRARARKSPNSEIPQTDVAGTTNAVTESVTRLVAERVDPTQTGQLRALEAGWDELLS